MEKLQQRLQFVITIFLFFPVILDALYKQANNYSDFNKTILSWGLTISVLILDYILLEFVKKWNYKNTFKYIDYSLFVILGSFAFVFYILAATQSFASLPHFLIYFFLVSTGSLQILPLLILTLLITDQGIFYFKSH